MAEQERLEITDRAQLREWLEANHTQDEAIWLVTYKKSARPGLYVPWEDVVQEALCFGWIDSQAAKVDEERSMVRLSPRRTGSGWSGVNKRHIEVLEANGLMTDAGRARIEQAKQDGSWEFLDDIEAEIIPDDLGAAFAEYPGSLEYFEGFSRANRRATLYWIKTAKRPETRAKRIAEAAEQSAMGVPPR